MCSCLMNTKVASGKLVMHDIPYAFSGVCIKLDNSLRKLYSVLLRYRVIYSMFKYLTGLLDNCPLVPGCGPIWLLGTGGLGSRVGCLLIRQEWIPGICSLTKPCLILSDFQIAGLLEPSHQTVNAWATQSPKDMSSSEGSLSSIAFCTMQLGIPQPRVKSKKAWRLEM